MVVMNRILLTFTVIGIAYTATSSYTQTAQILTVSDSVSSYEITWKFTVPVQTGQFVNGEYYVVGPVTVQSINPAPANHRNGSVLNLPINQGKSGFDNRVSSNRYDSTMRAVPPIALKPGDALISSISVDSVGKTYRWLREGEEKTISPVKSVSVLTCLAAPVSPDAFRPSYCDRTQTLYHANDLHPELLPKLAKVNTIPSLDEFAEHFQRPWLDVCFFGFDAPIGYQPDYGRETGRAVGMASLLLMLDYSDQEKRKLLINLVQYGIDLWGIARAGYPGWQAHGGHGSGRKWPIIFAGIMLNDSAMKSPTKTLPNLRFGEDMQTMYDTCWTGAKVVYAGHQGVFNGQIVSTQPGWGPYEHLRPANWVSELGESYRRCCTSLCWIGQALAALLLNAKAYWNHNAFFDYCDRWMTEDDSAHVRIIKQENGQDYSASWERQKQCWDRFVEQMWAKYRSSIAGTAYNQHPRQFPGGLCAFPNPCRTSAALFFTLREPALVTIGVYTAAGRLVRTLSAGNKAAGKHSVTWDTNDMRGNPAGNGFYFCSARIGGRLCCSSIILMR